jgi:hypothetical protein
MESIRAVSAAKAARPAIFIASSGHELGHYGLDAFLKEHQTLIKDAAAWIHLGANIGAAGGQMRLQASDDEIEGRMVRALDEASATVRQRVPRGTVPAGEARNIHVGGGRRALLGAAVSTRQDRWPAAVDVTPSRDMRAAGLEPGCRNRGVRLTTSAKVRWSTERFRKVEADTRRAESTARLQPTRTLFHPHANNTFPGNATNSPR